MISSRPALSGRGPYCGPLADDPHLPEPCSLVPGHTDGAAAEFWTALALKAAFLALDPPRVPSKQGQIDGCWTALGQAQRHSVLATLAGAGLGGGRGLPRAGGAGPKGRALGKALLGLPPGPPPFPPPKGKERLINQLLWATKQNKSH